MSKTHLQRSDTATLDMMFLFLGCVGAIGIILPNHASSGHPLWTLALIPAIVLAAVTAFDLFTVTLRSLHARLE